jgi:cephalosporin hydroxylase
MILGPIQNEDILLIQAIMHMTCPSVVVEFGTQTGVSTNAILDVLKGHLYSFDPHKQHNIEHPNFTFINDVQENYALTVPVDVVFFDGSHNYDSNMLAYQKIEPFLSKESIIIVHDTGLWEKPFVQNGGYANAEGYLHQPHERRFVNDLRLNKIHLHTMKEVRHGMTILQKPYELSL